MASRSIWATLLVVVLSGVVKAQWHFIQLAMVGAMGLTGMWMMHKLAQDYNKIKNPRPPAGAPVAKLFFRRSDTTTHSSAHNDGEGLDLDRVLREDPVGCAQRMVCQLAALPRHRLTAAEGNILSMVRAREGALTRAEEVFRVAAQLGQQSSEQTCINKYPSCPYTRSEIARLIQL